MSIIKLLLRINHSFSAQASLHPYLLDGLKRNKLLPLRACQEKALNIAKEGKNIIINQMDGSGKSLAYLLPILNRLYFAKSQPPKPKSGAIIATLNKELALGIYQQIRKIDFKNILNVNRCSSVTHYSPAIEEMCKKKEEQNQDQIIDLMYKNVAESVIWPQTDILISTPQTLFKVLSKKLEEKKRVSPEFIVIDDADLMIGRKEDFLVYMKKNYQILKKISTKEGNFKFIISTPFDDAIQQASSIFEHQTFDATNYAEPKTIIEKLKIRKVDIGTVINEEDTLKKKIEQLLAIMETKKQKRVVIYCNPHHLQQIKTALKTKLNINTAEYFAKLSSEKRMSALFEFNYKKSNVLLTTELANRGFSFIQPIDTVISFQPCVSGEQEMVRMCRSNKDMAEYIIFENEKNGFSSQLAKLKENKRFGKYLKNINVKQINFKKEEKAI